MASTDPLQALVAAAAAGHLPAGAQTTEKRRRHIERVAGLMDAWARALALPEADVARWRAAAFLHDALRDADPEEIRSELPSDLRDVPAALVHGPAVAARLEAAGVRDAPLLDAVRWHTLGHARLD
ncbi:MAG TPA: HD domain-containing protein, partial [Longimicrobiales bacterium]|nr:HD domain-containing protein [Longimicrobiales bacterium]